MISVLKSNINMDTASRLERWEDVKVTSFTRFIALVYVTALQSMLTKTLIHILGRWIYQHPQGDRITEEMYLSFSWYFCNIGWKDFLLKVQKVVKDELSKYSLKQQLKFENLQEIISQIRSEIHVQFMDYSSFLLPIEGEEECFLSKYQEELELNEFQNNQDLIKLLNETRDYLER